MAATIGGFLALRRRQWWWAALAGFAAGLTRPVGALFALPAAVEAARELRRDGWAGVSGRVAAVLAAPAGTATYLVWVGIEHGDALLPFRVQQRNDLRGSFTSPFDRSWEAARGLFGEAPLGDGLHFPFIVGFAVLLVVVLRQWPLSYGLYSGALLVVALSGESLGSFERYGLAAFPLLLAMAGMASSPRVERALMGACGAGLVSFTVLAWLGAYVP
jgi:hypothetical protein